MVTDRWLPGSVAWLPIHCPPLAPLLASARFCQHRCCYTGVLMKCCRMPWLPSLKPGPQASCLCWLGIGEGG